VSFAGRLRNRIVLVTVALSIGAFALAPVAHAGATEFPDGYQRYETNAEVDAALDSVVAQYGQGPDAIARRYVIGHSFEGREIWALKISDNVATDEDEPEVLSESGLHAREHISVEMAMYLVYLLTVNYGNTDTLGERVTSIVNSREIWIIPIVNPDGTEFDISGGTFHKWRKNRQTFAGTNAVGIDLNRNFGFMWGSKGSAGKPGSGQYRREYPFQAPEAAALRDFVLSRRIGGRQQLTGVLNWHSYGEFIYWPYGYTKEDIPPTMTVDDHSTFVALAQHMASLNGYRARQGSDSYLYAGDFPAWAYGDQRLFVFTLEMYPPWGAKAGGFYPIGSIVDAQLERNRDAALYFLEQADCPYRAAGLERLNCGPLYEDFEIDRGWEVNPAGTDSATTGAWERGIPRAASDGVTLKQRGNVTSGQAALVTGAWSSGDATVNDVDGGVTSARTPSFQLRNGGWVLRFRYTFAHDAGATAADFLRVSVVDGSTVTPVWTLIGKSLDRKAKWKTGEIRLDAWAGKDVRLLFEAQDGGPDNVLEAVVDDVRVFAAP
jgi:carboxypeptidase T